jgi:MFS family permease
VNRFTLFWFARTFSFYGDYIFSMTVVWFALKQGGAMEVAAVSTMLVVFRALGSFLLAPLINYIGSRMMIVSADMLRAVMNVLLWAMVYSHSSWVWPTLLFNAISAFLGGAFDSGMQTFIPTISAKLREANADLSRGRSLMQFLGYLTGGVLIQWFLGVGFLINALTFVVAGLISYLIGGGEPTLHDKIVRASFGDLCKKFAQNWKQSWQALRTSHTLRLAFWTTMLINLFITPMIALVAPLVNDTSGGGGIMYSVIQCASVVGGLIGATWVRKSKFKDAHLMIIASIACGAVGLVAGSSHMVIFLAVTMLLFGFASAVYNVSESTAIQKSESHLRASITGIISISFLFLYPVTALSAGRLVMTTDVHLPFLLAGIVVVVATLFCAWRWMLAEGNSEGNKGQEAEVPL